jgi:hypothetical protein
MEDNENKNIDQSWKERAEQEKEKIHEEKQFTPPEPDFSFFVTTLSLQASIFLGILPNPATDKKEQDVVQAKFIIDTLDMIKEKTQGNLTVDEAGLLDNYLYELRLQYINITENKVPGKEEKKQ